MKLKTQVLQNSGRNVHKFYYCKTCDLYVENKGNRLKKHSKCIIKPVDRFWNHCETKR